MNSWHDGTMTENEKLMVRALIAMAWADGSVEEPEAGVIEGLFSAFDTSNEEEQELLLFAKTPKKLVDIPLETLSHDEQETLLMNAALLTHADGELSDAELQLLQKLISKLSLSEEDVRSILKGVENSLIRSAH